MKHNINALAALNSIHAVPDNCHYGSIEGGPPSTTGTERGSVENWETNVVLGASPTVEYNDDSDECLTSG